MKHYFHESKSEELIDNHHPIFDSKEVLEGIEALPKGLELINAAVKVLNNTWIQDILGEFSVGSGAPALPPKQNAIPSSSSNNANNLTTSSSALNRPSSVQREKISNSLKALPRPPSRVSQTSVTALSRPRGTPSPALGSSPKETNSGKMNIT